MDADKKAKIARILGYILLAVGVLNLTLAGVQLARDRTQAGSLFVTSFVALGMGIIMVSRGRQKPTPRA